MTVNNPKSDASPGMAQLRHRVGQVCRLVANYEELLEFTIGQDAEVGLAIKALVKACAGSNFEKSPELTGTWDQGSGGGGPW